MAQAEGLHVKGSGDQAWNVLNQDLPCDVEATERPALDEVTRVVETTRINRENLVVADVHVRTEKIKEHVPCTNESLLVNAGETS